MLCDWRILSNPSPPNPPERNLQTTNDLCMVAEQGQKLSMIKDCWCLKSSVKPPPSKPPDSGPSEKASELPSLAPHARATSQAAVGGSFPAVPPGSAPKNEFLQLLWRKREGRLGGVWPEPCRRCPWSRLTCRHKNRRY